MPADVLMAKVDIEKIGTEDARILIVAHLKK